MRSPFSYVPFDEPRSVTHQPAAKRSRTACRRLTVGSSVSAMSFSAALPTVDRSPASATRQLPLAGDHLDLRAPRCRSLRAASLASEAIGGADDCTAQGPLRAARDARRRRRGAGRQGARPPARPVVALKIRHVRDAADREDAARRGADPARRSPPHPALPLVREDFFDGDDYVVAMDWVDGHRPRPALRDRGPPGPGAVERARLPGRGGRGAHAPAHPGPARHPRRRQARRT